MLNFFLDFPNFLLIFIFVFVFYMLKLIPNWVAILLSISALVPYFLNDVLFPATYMPDQFRYLDLVKDLRGFDVNYDEESRTVETAGWLLALVPLPFVETIKSLGFFNRFIMSALIIWLYVRKNIRGFALLFLLLYPSLILYSSLSLRDTLVTLFMVLPVIFLIEGKYIKFAFFSLPLFFLKFQNFFLLIIFFIFYNIRKKQTFYYRFRYLFYLTIFLLFLPFLNEVISLVDFYRRAMYLEEGGEPIHYVNVVGFLDFVIMGMKSAPYFLTKPLPWEAANLLQLIQSIENVLVVFALSYFFLQAYKKDKYTTITWMIYLFICLSVYGLVVFNYGTAARYKFTFFVLVVIGLSYDLSKKYEARNLKVLR